MQLHVPHTQDMFVAVFVVVKIFFPSSSLLNQCVYIQNFEYKQVFKILDSLLAYAILCHDEQSTSSSSQVLGLIPQVLKFHFRVSLYLSLGLPAALFPLLSCPKKNAFGILVSSILKRCLTQWCCALIIWISMLGISHFLKTSMLETLSYHLMLQIDLKQSCWNWSNTLMWRQ